MTTDLILVRFIGVRPKVVVFVTLIATLLGGSTTRGGRTGGREGPT